MQFQLLEYLLYLSKYTCFLQLRHHKIEELSAHRKLINKAIFALTLESNKLIIRETE